MLGGGGAMRGQVALVTGGGRGIGRAVALAMGRAGASVAICARTPAQLDAVAGELDALGAPALARACDVTDGAAVEAMLAAVNTRFGRLDVLVNNAGGSDAHGTLLDSAPDAWWRTVEVNLRGTYLVTRAALPLLRRSAPSRIINVGSGLGHGPRPGNSAYAAAKAGVWMLTRCLAEEVWPLGIEVNEVVPGPVATDATRDTMRVGGPPPYAESERVKTPEEVAEAVLWLATRPAGGPTGQTLSLARRPL